MKLPESARQILTVIGRAVLIVLALIGLHDVLNQVGGYFGIDFPPENLTVDLALGAFVLIVLYVRSFTRPL